MAVVTYVKYKPGNNSTPAAMKGVIDYCCQPHKTQTEEKVFAISGKDCTGEFAFREFMSTKKLYGKENGVMFYHYVQSFSPEEDITPEEANKIGLELAKEFGGFEVLVATHIDREHVHNHLVINSVSAENGYKLRQNPGSLNILRSKSDEICLRYGKSVLPKYEKSGVKGISPREYRAADKGNSWKFQLMNTIDSAMSESGSKADFIREMKSRGYEMTWTDTRKYITFINLHQTDKNGKPLRCRDIKLHDEKYLKENLENELQFREQAYRKHDRQGQATTEKQHKPKRNLRRIDTGYGTHTADRLERNAPPVERDSGGATIHQRPAERAGDSRSTGEFYRTDFANIAGGIPADGTACGESAAQNAGTTCTGWEDNRAEYERFLEQGQRIGDGNREGVKESVTENPNHMERDNHPVSGGFGVSVGSAVRALAGLSDEPEDPEERRKRIEAQENSEAIGALAGLAIGLAMGAVAESEAPEEEQDNEFKMEM